LAPARRPAIQDPLAGGLTYGLFYLSAARPPTGHGQNLGGGDSNVARGKPDDDDSGLLSERSLIIVVLAIAVGGLAGLTAGLSAGISLVHRIGPGWALVAGLLAGFAASAVTGLVTVRALHDLITKRLPGPRWPPMQEGPGSSNEDPGPSVELERRGTRP
jgi:hypothetical protein